ncbi:hypothetical protein niasHS_010897 [Heterodera schachtii]|uniref:NOC3-like protein n=1 Tax=Heterodera schachtii TaxID=97005 RepID=A0ABD2IZK8_HETSC
MKKQRIKATKKLTKMAKKGKLRRNVRDQMGEVQRQKMLPKEKRMEQIKRDWLFERKVREREQNPSSAESDGETEELPKRRRKSRKNRKNNGEDGERMEQDGDMEEQMRSFVAAFGEDELLPVKVAGRLVRRVKIREDEEDETEQKPDDLDTLQRELNDGNMEMVSDGTEGTQLADKRQITAAESEAMLAAMAGAIVAEPQQNIAKFRLLLQMASGDNELSPSVREHSQKLAVASLTELFVNVLPGKGNFAEIFSFPFSFGLAEYEHALLNYYLKFLRLLEKNANKILQKGKRHSLAEKAPTFSTQFSFICVRCLCRLIDKCSHFNFAKNVITCLVRLSTTPWKKMSEEICATISEVFRADFQLQISAHGTNSIALLVNKKAASVPAALLATFLALNITENEANITEKKNQSQMGEKWKSKRSKKYDKQIGKIDAELKEAIETEAKSTKTQLATQTIKNVFLTYCRVLKRMPATALLHPVLAGLSKFVHLINAELLEDLARHLANLVHQKQFGFSDVLHCVHTAAVVLEGDGRLLGVDLLSFYGAIFGALPNVCFQPEQTLFTDLSLLSKSLHLLFVRRRKSAVSPARVAAFAKRLALLALPLQSHAQAVLLLTLRRLLLAHPSLSFLVHIDEEAPFASGRFLPDSADPDHSNAMATNLHLELQLFAKHPNALVRSVAMNLLNGMPSTGKFHLEAKWTTIEPSDCQLMDDPMVEDKRAPFLVRILQFCEENKRKYCSTTLCSTLCDFVLSAAKQ